MIFHLSQAKKSNEKTRVWAIISGRPVFDSSSIVQNIAAVSGTVITVARAFKPNRRPKRSAQP